MIKPTIQTVTTANADQAIGTVVLAFSADPVARWFYPDPHQYLLHLPDFVRAFAGKAFEHNSAYYIDGYQGAALWLPPDVHPDENALVALLQRTIPEENQQEIFAFMEQMDSYHPAEPHWYLPMIGVDPAKQGKGYGSALLQHALERFDGEGKLAYLEASSPKSIPLYERHGFELVGTIQVGSSPPLFPMLRKPPTDKRFMIVDRCRGSAKKQNLFRYQLRQSDKVAIESTVTPNPSHAAALTEASDYPSQTPIGTEPNSTPGFDA